MITDLFYWVFLAFLVAALAIAPSRIRFFLTGSLSFIFLLLLLGSISGQSQDTPFSLSDLVFVEEYRVAYYLFLWTLLFYYCPRIFVDSKKTAFRVQLLLIVSILFYLAYNKYIPVVLGYIAGQTSTVDMLVPLGISYFTFKLIHYSVEYGRGNFAPHKFSEFFTYIYLFPIYTAGPIERFDHFQNNWNSDSRSNDIIEGGTRIVYGLIKKFFVISVLLLPMLSNNTADSILIRLENIEIYKVWGFLLVSYLIIYVDFSAYSDIAIGSSRLMGFRIMENFNWPVLATNITMLWKRWHMTLSGWCQAYVYMPSIGLTRKPLLAVLLTFLAVGLWHGAAYSWIAWGLYQGLGVIVFIRWTQWKIKRKLKIPSNWATKFLACMLTNIWMAGSFSFTVTISDGSFTDVLNAFKLLGKCIGINF